MQNMHFLRENIHSMSVKKFEQFHLPRSYRFVTNHDASSVLVVRQRFLLPVFLQVASRNTLSLMLSESFTSEYPSQVDLESSCETFLSCIELFSSCIFEWDKFVLLSEHHRCRCAMAVATHSSIPSLNSLQLRSHYALCSLMG